MQLTTTHRLTTVMLIVTGIVVILATVSTGARADVLINNLGIDATKYQTVYGPSAHGLNGETGGGISLSPTSDYYLNSISVIANYVSGNTGTFDLALFRDNAGLPGSLVASRTITPSNLGVFQTYFADFGSSIVLTSGATYWAVVYTTGASNNILLRLQKGPYDQNNLAILPSTQLAMYGNMGSGGSPYWMHMWNPGIQVTGTLAPEPSGFLALVGGFAPLVGFAALRRRKANR